MQRICKTCKKEIVNMMSNFCSTTCFTKFSEKRRALFISLINREKSKLEKGQTVTKERMMELKHDAQTLFNPMENEYQ